MQLSSALTWCHLFSMIAQSMPACIMLPLHFWLACIAAGMLGRSKSSFGSWKTERRWSMSDWTRSRLAMSSQPARLPPPPFPPPENKKEEEKRKENRKISRLAMSRPPSRLPLPPPPPPFLLVAPSCYCSLFASHPLWHVHDVLRALLHMWGGGEGGGGVKQSGCLETAGAVGNGKGVGKPLPPSPCHISLHHF